MAASGQGGGDLGDDGGGHYWPGTYRGRRPFGCRPRRILGPGTARRRASRSPPRARPGVASSVASSRSATSAEPGVAPARLLGEERDRVVAVPRPVAPGRRTARPRSRDGRSATRPAGPARRARRGTPDRRSPRRRGRSRSARSRPGSASRCADSSWWIASVPSLSRISRTVSPSAASMAASESDHRPAQAVGDPPADRGLAAPHEPEDHDVAGRRGVRSPHQCRSPSDLSAGSPSATRSTPCSSGRGSRTGRATGPTCGPRRTGRGR